MGKKTLSENEYKDKIGYINGIRDDVEYKMELSNLYQQNSVPPDLKRKRLRKLMNNVNKKFFKIMTFAVSNILSAIITCKIPFEEYDSIPVFIVALVFIGIFVLLYVSIIGFLLVVTSLTSQEIKRQNIEIDILIDATNKKDMASLLCKEGKESRKTFFFSFIYEAIIGIIGAVIATFVVLRIRN